jgi:hypothetical protein
MVGKPVGQRDLDICRRRWENNVEISAAVLSGFGEISGSHGGEYEDDCLLECCVV